MDLVCCCNHFCIYWEAGFCTRANVSLDVRGGCLSGIPAIIDEHYLNEKREETRKRFAWLAEQNGKT